METRTPSMRQVLPAAVFALACVIVTLIALRTFGAATPLQARGYRLTVPLPDATNVVQGSDVQISGVKIGRVVALSRRGSRADATLEVRPPYAPLHQDAVAMVRTKTLLGEAYVQISPGLRTAPILPDGGRIAPEHVRPSVQLDEFLSAFSPQRREQFRRLLTGLATAVRGRGQDINDTLGTLPSVTDDLNTVLAAVQRQRSALQSLISSAADVLDAAGERDGQLRAAVTAGDRVLSVTADRDADLARTVRALPPLLSALGSASDELIDAAPELRDAVTALAPAAARLRPALDQVRAAAPQFRGLFNDLPSVIAAGRRGLPAVSAIATGLRHGFQGFYPTARELIPLAQLLALNRFAPVYLFANTGAVAAGTFRQPDGRIANYLAGLPTVWNETVAGWVKRLPTNRSNPYGKPPYSLLDTGRLGYLKSYDCRNVNNTLYLPATGNGAPPCVEQQPWTFQGRTAQYPRLLRDRP